jgi:hypothetical protein
VARAGTRSVVERGRPLLGGLVYLQAWGVPSTSPNTFLWTPLLGAAAADGADVVLDGEGGDELFDSMPFYLFADLVASGRLAAAWRLTARYRGVRPGGGRRRRARVLAHFLRSGLAPAALLRRRDARHAGEGATALLRPADARAALEVLDRWAWRDEDGPRWWGYRVGATTRMRHLLDQPGSLRRTAALAGIADRHPLMLDTQLLEFALRLPPEHSFDNREDRPLARASQAGRLPAAILRRTTKSHFSGVLADGLLGADGAMIGELLDPGSARIREYVDVESFAALRRDDRRRLAEIWRLGALECWLRQLESPGFAAELRDTQDST